MRKLISFLLFFTILFPFFAIETRAARSSVENGTFESGSVFWNTGSFSQDNPQSGEYCLSFSAPAEDDENGIVHSISYIPRLALVANTVYEVSFYVRTNTALDTASSIEGKILYSAGQPGVSVCFSNIPHSWQKASFLFMVNSTNVFDFSLQFPGLAEDAVIFIDDVSVSDTGISPVRLDIQGPTAVTIPDAGENVYAFAPAILDTNGNSIMMRTANLTLQDEGIEGVSFDKERGLLHVSSDASENSTLSILCTPLPGSTTFPAYTIPVFLSKNLLANGSFADSPAYLGWDTETTPFSILHDEENTFAVVPMAQTDAQLYTGRITPSQTFVLFAHEMYVFHAKVKSSPAYEKQQIQTRVLSPDEAGAIRIQTAEIGGGDWTEIICAFRVPRDGIYPIELDFFSVDDRPIYIDEIRIQPETLKPSVIHFDLPKHCSIQKETATELPISYSVLNQENTVCNTPVHFSVFPEGQGVSVSDAGLYISPFALPGTYQVSAMLAENEDIQTVRYVSVSDASIGDGSFEKTAPGEWWATAQPSELHYVSTYNNVYPSHGVRLARLTMNGSVSALLSDSVYKYTEQQSYVFEADMITTAPDIPTTATILVENSASESFDDNLVVGQFTLSSAKQRIQVLFTPSETVTGRLIIAFNTPETHNQQVILMDAISISVARVEVQDVTISGFPYLDMNLTGKYKFSSNFETPDSSICRWLFSSTTDGIYMPVEGATGNTLSITRDMLGKYVKLEVTPVSLRGPVVGASLQSSAIRIAESTPPDEEIYEQSTPPASAENGNTVTDKEETPPTITPPPPVAESSGMTVIILDNFTVQPRHQFLDLTNHWAKHEIEILTAAGVVQGRGNGLFEPYAPITRAEFSTFLARAFSLAPIYYEGQFQDVHPHSWYAGAIAVVTKHGIAKGTSETTFSPELPITREEMAVMIMRAYRKATGLVHPPKLSFTDTGKISSWATTDVGEACALGLMTGFPDGSFNASHNASRAEAAITIQRMLSVISTK